MSSTSTITRTARARDRSLSLIARPAPPSAFFTLPVELTLDILELVVHAHRPTLFALARTCSTLAHFVDRILYRAVVLPSLRALSLFARTAHARGAPFLAAHVRKFVITTTATVSDAQKPLVCSILDACISLRTVVLPASLADAVPAVHAFHTVPTEFQYLPHTPPSPCEIILDTYTPLSFAPLPGVARLRISEPSDAWHAPLAALAPETLFPRLTHLHIARRAHANEENDAVFVADVRTFLDNRKLQMLVVSVFPRLYSADDVRTSEIWGALEAVGDARLVLREGSYGAWRETWKSAPVVSCADAQFWEEH